MNGMSDRPRVVVADGRRGMLNTLVRLLAEEFEVVGAVTDGLALVATATQLAPDVLVLDIALPGLNGIAAAVQVRQASSTVRFVFVTQLRDREFLQEALALGDVGFVIKNRVIPDLVMAVREVRSGRSFVSPILPF